MSVLRRQKVIREAGRRAARAKTESRTGMVWDIQAAQRTCRVVFQGAWDDKVTVQFPSNSRETPTWLKTEAAVEVRHPAGNQSALMAVGPGSAVPTPEAGQTSAPVVATGVNCILSGCGVYVNSGMQVFVQPGTFRISDIVYSTELWAMSADSPVVLQENSPLTLGQVAEVVQLAAADTSGYRYDLLAIGADKVIDYIQGTVSANMPEKPVLPAAHVKVAYILVPPGITELGQDNIDQSYVAATAAMLEVDTLFADLAWGTSTSPLTVTVLDQYGQPLAGNWTIDAQITSGSGSIGSFAMTGGAASASFVYTRAGEGTEENPVMITFTLHQKPDITAMTGFALMDSLGGLI